MTGHQNRIVPSNELDAILEPSGDRATDVTYPIWSFRGLPMVSPVTALQIRIVSSYEPDIMRVPSRENTTDDTCSVCPCSGLQTPLPVA